MADTRTRILAEATAQLTSVGYTAFTVAAVRDALGLSSGSMFHAFPSKAALAAAVYVAGMEDYQRTAIDAIEHAGDVQAALNAFIAAHVGWVEDHGALARYLFGTLPDEVMTEAHAPLAVRNRTYFGALEQLFQRAAKAGLVGSAVDAQLAQALSIGPAQEYARRWTRGLATQPPRKLIRTFQRAARAALATTITARARTRQRKQEART